jgi:hypothetical protein
MAKKKKNILAEFVSVCLKHKAQIVVAWGILVSAYGLLSGLIQHSVASVVKSSVDSSIQPLTDRIDALALQADVDHDASDFVSENRSLDCDYHYDRILDRYKAFKALEKPVGSKSKDKVKVMDKVSAPMRKVIHKQVLDACSHRNIVPTLTFDEVREFESELKNEGCAGNFWYKIGLCYLSVDKLADARRAFEQGLWLIRPNGDGVQVADAQCIAMYILCEVYDDQYTNGIDKREAALLSINGVKKKNSRAVGHSEEKAVLDALEQWKEDAYTLHVLYRTNASSRRLGYTELVKVMKGQVAKRP